MRNKIIMSLVIVVALLFLLNNTASAASLASPSYVNALITTSSTSAYNTNYNFIVGADGIFVNNTEYATEDAYQLFCTTSYASGIMQVSFDTGIVASSNAFSSDMKKGDGYFLTLTPSFNATLNYDDGGFNVFNKTLVSVSPYVIVDGVKHPLANNGENQVFPDNIPHQDLEYYFGADIDIIVSYDAGTNTLYDVKTTFGTVKLNLNVPAFDIETRIYKEVSTGEQLITDAINKQSQSIWDVIYAVGSEVTMGLENQTSTLNKTLVDSNISVLSSIGNFSTMVSNCFTTMFEFMTSETSNTAYAAGYLYSIKELVTTYFPVFDATMDNILITSENIYSQFQTFRKEFSDFGSNLTTLLTEHHNSLSDKLEEIKNTLTKGYDTTDSDKASDSLDSTLANYEDSQKEVTDIAVENLDSFTIPSDGFLSYEVNFVKSLSLVSGMLQSVYDSLGPLKIIVSVLMIMTLVSMITGLTKFFKG